MDNNAYERDMIDCVNRNSKNAEQARREAYLATKEEQTHNRRCKKSDAAAQIIVWIGVFLSLVLCMFYLNWLGVVPGEFPATICAVVGLVTGARVNALARAFRK